MGQAQSVICRMRLRNLGKGIDFRMIKEFDDVFEDDITTLTFTYADVVIPEIPDAEGIHIVENK